ncbi:hypothetical protein PG995_011125 [Apiospora arundinis]
MLLFSSSSFPPSPQKCESDRETKQIWLIHSTISRWRGPANQAVCLNSAWFLALSKAAFPAIRVPQAEHHEAHLRKRASVAAHQDDTINEGLRHLLGPWSTRPGFPSIQSSPPFPQDGPSLETQAAFLITWIRNVNV